MAEYFIAEEPHYHAADRAIVGNISLVLERDELVALISLNGAGKSTLLRLLTGFLKPATGHCVLSGKLLEGQPTQKLSRYRAVTRQQTQSGPDWPVEAVIVMGRALWS